MTQRAAPSNAATSDAATDVVPEPGTATKGLDKGWLVNTWFRLKHPDYDKVRELMTFLGETVKADAR